MSHQPSSYALSLREIKQRYEDTALNLFKIFKKRKNRPRPLSYLGTEESRKSFSYSCQGNTAVVVQRIGSDVTKADEKPVERIGMKTLNSIDDICDLESNWYSLEFSLLHTKPSSRVGHSLIHNTQENSIFCIGGADPDGPRTDLHVLDLNSMKWKDLPSVGFSPRYEHSSFACFVENKFNIFVFGGADTSGNKNDLQLWKAGDSLWKTVKVKGCVPSRRTQHNCATADSLLYVFAGGNVGTEPVNDRSVYCFDAELMTWKQIEVSGSPPTSRQGHAMTTIGNKVYIHGGMCGSEFFDDFYAFDTKANQWTLLSPTGCKPSPRAAHSCVSVENSLYLYGGLGQDGALSDLFRFDLKSECWQLIELQNQVPSARLDFAMCIVTVNHSGTGLKSSIRVDNHSGNSEDEISTPTTCDFPKVRNFILIHGGMDTLGNMYDDSYLYVL